MQAADQFTQRMNLPRCLNLVHPFGETNPSSTNHRNFSTDRCAA